MASEAIMNDGLTEGQQELDQEADLISRAKARSPEAWTEIYESSHPKLFRYVMARVGQQDLAEDLTATVFMEALKSIDTYSCRGRPFLAWLYRVARNVVNYHHRTAFRRNAGRALLGAPTRVLSQVLSAKRRQDPQAAEAPSVNEAGELADPASAVERWDLREAIARLSRDQREVIILRYYVGLTTPEVASLVGKHERAVYSLQSRAIKALRRHLR
jgi:RNA polymerase sigma-70 factor (ECF subfamily)